MTNQSVVKMESLREVLTKYSWETVNNTSWKHKKRINREIVIGIQAGWVFRKVDFNESDGYSVEARGISSEELEKYLAEMVG